MCLGREIAVVYPGVIISFSSEIIHERQLTEKNDEQNVTIMLHICLSPSLILKLSHKQRAHQLTLQERSTNSVRMFIMNYGKTSH